MRTYNSCFRPREIIESIYTQNSPIELRNRMTNHNLSEAKLRGIKLFNKLYETDVKESFCQKAIKYLRKIFR